RASVGVTGSEVPLCEFISRNGFGDLLEQNLPGPFERFPLIGTELRPGVLIERIQVGMKLACLPVESPLHVVAGLGHLVEADDAHDNVVGRLRETTEQNRLEPAERVARRKRQRIEISKA